MNFAGIKRKPDGAQNLINKGVSQVQLFAAAPFMSTKFWGYMSTKFWGCVYKVSWLCLQSFVVCVSDFNNNARNFLPFALRVVSVDKARCFPVCQYIKAKFTVTPRLFAVVCLGIRGRKQRVE